MVAIELATIAIPNHSARCRNTQRNAQLQSQGVAMADSFSRRSLLERASVAVPFSAFAGAASLHRPTAQPPADSPESKIDILTDQFPTQPPELVREMVTV